MLNLKNNINETEFLQYLKVFKEYIKSPLIADLNKTTVLSHRYICGAEQKNQIIKTQVPHSSSGSF